MAKRTKGETVDELLERMSPQPLPQTPGRVLLAYEWGIWLREHFPPSFTEFEEEARIEFFATRQARAEALVTLVQPTLENFNPWSEFPSQCLMLANVLVQAHEQGDLLTMSRALVALVETGPEFWPWLKSQLATSQDAG